MTTTQNNSRDHQTDAEQATEMPIKLGGDGFETKALHRSILVDADLAGKRLDQAAASIFSEFSREQLKSWITSGELTLDDSVVKPKQRVKLGQCIEINAHIRKHSEDQPENIPLDILFEDDCLLVINKPAGLVVHPGAGNWTGTLVNGLLHHNAQLAALPRAGLVHRIDKDTTGLLVVAKTAQAQQHLTAQLKDKSVYRHYQAVVLGTPPASGTVDAPIARHPTQRTKMAVVDTYNPSGKVAVSHFQTERTFDHAALVSVRLETGRTHQIRVHMAHIKCPLVGDATYTRLARSKTMSEAVFSLLKAFPRQALHAYRLGFVHPVSGDDCTYEAALPDDMLELIDNLKKLDVN